MPFGPFFNAVRGTTAGTPGTGSFTPNAASTGFLAWSTVPSGWIGLVRYEDGSSWELAYGYWNGTVITRPSNIVASSSGSRLSLTSSATASLVADGMMVSPNPVYDGRGYFPQINSTALTNIGLPGGVATGTAAAQTLATTNYLTEQPRLQLTSATTANAQSAYSTTNIVGITSTTAGRGGWMYVARFGASGLPTGPRFFSGMTSTTFIANAGDPSALTANYAIIGKDSADTNLQLITNSNVSTGTKIDTGMALAVNDWFHQQIWTQPGSTTVYALLVKMNDGSIYYGSTNTDVPGNGSLLMPQCIGSLAATTGTAIVFHFGGFAVRNGGSL